MFRFMLEAYRISASAASLQLCFAGFYGAERKLGAQMAIAIVQGLGSVPFPEALMMFREFAYVVWVLGSLLMNSKLCGLPPL